jgi:hypothetical protein
MDKFNGLGPGRGDWCVWMKALAVERKLFGPKIGRDASEEI